MERLKLESLQYEFSRHLAPRIRVAPGTTLQIESEDALSGQIRKAGDQRDKSKMPYSNPINGPVGVIGAEPGDTLAVTIHAIEPLIGQCSTYTGGARLLSEWLGPGCPPGGHVCPIRDGFIHWKDRVKIPYAPMLGCIGTSPDWGVPTTYPAGPHGGNLDLIEVSPGNTIHLPVFVPEALLYLGDAHAAMGHGELSANGLEMPALSTISVELIKGRKIPTPRIETPTEIMTVATAAPLERCIAHAYSLLILWLEADYGWDRWDAYDLLTHVGRISIGFYGNGTVAAKVEKRFVTG